MTISQYIYDVIHNEGSESYTGTSRDRLYHIPPKTLAEAGKAYGVTREAARISTARATDRILENPEVETVVQTVVSEAGIIESVDHLKSSVEGFLELPEDIQNVILNVSGLRLVAKGEYVVNTETLLTFRTHLQSLFKDNTGVPISELSQQENITESHIKVLVDLRLLGKIRTADGHIFPSKPSKLDLAEVYLRDRDEVASVDEITTAVGATSPNSLRERMHGDPRFVRTTVNKWALSEWGVREHTTVVAWLKEYISTHKNITREQLVAAARTEIGASRSSVNVYTYSLGYRYQDGVLVRDTGKSDEVKTDITTARNVFNYKGLPSVLLTVSDIHLRGVSPRIPASIPALFGVKVPGKETIHSDFGDMRVSISQARTASLSSIRAVLQDMNARVGDRVWLMFDPEGSRVTFEKSAVTYTGTKLSRVGLPAKSTTEDILQHLFLDENASKADIDKRMSRKTPRYRNRIVKEK